MKTILITFIASLFLAHTENKDLSGKGYNDPTGISKEQVYKDFGNVTITEFEKSKLYDEVTFLKDGHTITAFYDDKPMLIGTTERKTFTELPAKAQERVKSYYKDYSVGDIILFDDNEQNETDMVLYNQTFEDADNYFIELTKANRKIVVESNMAGEVSYFTRLQ